MLPSPHEERLGLRDSVSRLHPRWFITARWLAHHPSMASSIGSRDSVSFLLTIQATGFLTFTLVGLPPTEYASLRWTHVGSRTGAVLRRFGLSVAPRFLWECLTNRTVNRIPAPATSHVACGFPALRAPAHFTWRVMRPIRSERLPRATFDTIPGTLRRVPTYRTAIPCSTASNRSLDAGTPEPDDAESSSPPSFG